MCSGLRLTDKIIMIKKHLLFGEVLSSLLNLSNNSKKNKLNKTIKFSYVDFKVQVWIKKLLFILHYLNQIKIIFLFYWWLVWATQDFFEWTPRSTAHFQTKKKFLYMMDINIKSLVFPMKFKMGQNIPSFSLEFLVNLNDY